MADNDNNFKQMLFQDLEAMPDAPRQVETGIDGTVGFISHFAKVIELYIPKFIEAMMAFLGARDKKDK